MGRVYSTQMIVISKLRVIFMMQRPNYIILNLWYEIKNLWYEIKKGYKSKCALLRVRGHNIAASLFAGQY